MIGTKETFERCVRWMLDRTDTGWILCHGLVHGIGLLEGEVYSHCWLELPATKAALDLTTKTPICMPASKYREVTNAQVVAEYTLTQAASAVRENKSFGPWHPALQAAPSRVIH